MINKSERIVSLDVYRGIAVLAMLFVDYPGTWDNRFSIFNHADWNGITLADFIFPSFLFIMGVSMYFSINKRLEKGASKNSILKKSLKRSIILFILGYIINLMYDATFDITQIRLLGVLQRIAIVYFIVVCLYLYLSIKQILIIGISILIFYWGLLTLIPVPGFGMPDLSQYPSEAIPNLAAYVDYKVLGNLAWVWSRPFDPEGILSTIPAIVSTIAGLIFAQHLKKGRLTKKLMGNTIITGIILLIIGYIWSIFFPLNKKLWTSSFVVLTTGASLILFVLIYFLIEYKRVWKRYEFINYFGMNALTAFFLFGFFDATISLIKINSISIKGHIFNSLFNSWINTTHASYIYSIVLISIFGLLFRYMYKNKIFIKL